MVGRFVSSLACYHFAFHNKKIFDFIKLIIYFLFLFDYIINIKFKELLIMTITIRDKHTGDKTEFYDLFELYTDTKNLYVTIENIDGWKKEYTFEKKDYEIAYIG